MTPDQSSVIDRRIEKRRLEKRDSNSYVSNGDIPAQLQNGTI